MSREHSYQRTLTINSYQQLSFPLALEREKERERKRETEREREIERERERERKRESITMFLTSSKKFGVIVSF